MHLPNVTEGHPIRAKCFPDSALWFQDYSLFDEEAKVLLQNSWNSRRRIQKKLWNQHQQISSPWWLGWFWGLGTGLCCWTPSKNFPKNFNGGCTYTLWSWLALKASHPLASRWLRKAMSCQISKGQPQTSWKMHSLLPEGALCSGISAVGALQDSFKERSGSRTTPMLACLLGLKLWNFLNFCYQ